MALSSDNIFVLIVALLTWGLVFIYVLRLQKIAGTLEEEVRAREISAESDSSLKTL
jgi:hypothetical protein